MATLQLAANEVTPHQLMERIRQNATYLKPEQMDELKLIAEAYVDVFYGEQPIPGIVHRELEGVKTINGTLR